MVGDMNKISLLESPSGNGLTTSRLTMGWLGSVPVGKTGGGHSHQFRGDSGQSVGSRWGSAFKSRRTSGGLWLLSIGSGVWFVALGVGGFAERALGSSVSRHLVSLRGGCRLVSMSVLSVSAGIVSRAWLLVSALIIKEI